MKARERLMDRDFKNSSSGVLGMKALFNGTQERMEV